MIKYAWRKCMTDTIFLLRSGCFSMRIVWAVRTQGLSSRCFLKETYIPSLCSGGTPETSHSSTWLFVSLSKHMAKFRIPTSILRIIKLKDLYIFKLETLHGLCTRILGERLTRWGHTERKDGTTAYTRYNGRDYRWHSTRTQNVTNTLTNTFSTLSNCTTNTLGFLLGGLVYFLCKFLSTFIFIHDVYNLATKLFRNITNLKVLVNFTWWRL